MKHSIKAVAAASLAAAALAASVSDPLPALAQNLDLDQIFRCTEEGGVDAAHCGEARDIILNNCTTCHTFVPIVMQQGDEGEWRGLLDRHVGNGRVDQLSSEQVDQIHAYLAANFNGDLPPPELPEELLKTWTSY